MPAKKANPARKTLAPPKAARPAAAKAAPLSKTLLTAKMPEVAARQPAKSASKIEQVKTLLARQGGASLAQLMSATGWQAHSVRGALSGTIKKKLGLNVVSVRIEGQRRYRIVA